MQRGPPKERPPLDGGQAAGKVYEEIRCKTDRGQRYTRAAIFGKLSIRHQAIQRTAVRPKGPRGVWRA